MLHEDQYNVLWCASLDPMSTSIGMVHVLVRLFGPETVDYSHASFLAYLCIVQLFLIPNHDPVVLYHFSEGQTWADIVLHPTQHAF